MPDNFMTRITLSCFDRGYYPHFVVIHVPWILSAFCGYVCILWILSAFREYCGYFCIFVDVIVIGRITIYLARNVRPIFIFYRIV